MLAINNGTYIIGYHPPLSLSIIKIIQKVKIPDSFCDFFFPTISSQVSFVSILFYHFVTLLPFFRFHIAGKKPFTYITSTFCNMCLFVQVNTISRLSKLVLLEDINKFMLTIE